MTEHYFPSNDNYNPSHNPSQPQSYQQEAPVQQSNTGYEWAASQSIEDVLNSWIGGETSSFTLVKYSKSKSMASC
jgi:hypothetical protein